MNIDINTKEGELFVIFVIIFAVATFTYTFYKFEKDVTRVREKKAAEQQAQQRANQIFVRKMRVLERVVERTEGQISVPTFLMESEGGEKVILRLPLGSRIQLSVGDEGTVEYKGQYIQSFKRIESQEGKQE